MTMDTAKLEKMKVAELRNELQIRGLDTKGVKAVLIERLKAAIDNKTPVEGGTSEITEISTPSRRSRRTRSMTRSPSPSPVKKAEPTLEPLIEEEKTETTKSDPTDNEDDKKPEEESKLSSKIDLGEQGKTNEIEKEEDVEMHEDNPTESSRGKTETEENSTPHSEMPSEKSESDEKSIEKINVDKTQDSKNDEDTQKEQFSKTEENDKLTEKKEKRLSRKRSHSKSRSRSRTRDRSRSRSRSKHSQSRSPRIKRSTSRSKNIDESTNEEDEPVIEDKQFGLSWLDSDLHLTIDPVTFTSAKPMSQEIYSLVWSGARTNYGVREGKVCYEVRLAEETTVNLFKDEPFIRGLRCGFSTTKTNLLLGEGENSFAYCETGKKALNGEFIDYGKPLKLDDVVGCYLDLDSTPSTIQFTLNGEELGTAFEFSKEILGEEDALFPHILLKGYEVQVNFADSENLLGNVERPKRMRKKEKLRKNSSKSEDANAKDTSNTEDNWEIVDEAKMDDNDDEKNEKKEEKVKDDKEPNKSDENKDEEKKSNDDESVEEKEDNKEVEKDEANKSSEDIKKSITKEAADQEENKEEKEDKNENKNVLPEDTKENGHSSSENKKKSRESKDSNLDYIMEEIEPEEREEVVLLSRYELIALTPEDKYISGPQRPESRKECEVYLLVGLPGSGKTHWALNHIKENPDKRYHTIGADDLILKMTIDGKPRKPLHKGNWDRVYELCLESLSALEEIATKRRRNYILDQTNAFASAQRRKMKGFGDFKRNAVVCIPSEEELKKRNQLKTEAGTENTIKESTLNNLKASFTLPSLEFGWFDNIIYTDLKEDEAKDEVKRYNEKGSKDIDASRDKRQRRDNNNRQRDDRRRYEDRRRDDFRGSRWKGNGNDRRGGSGNRWGQASRGSSAPWRDDRPYGGGGGGRSYDSRNNRYSSGGGSGGGSQNWVNNNRNRYDDRFVGRSGGNSSGGGRSYDSYGGGSRDYRDRGRDRNGDGGDNGSRRDGGYRSGNNQRDFRSGHRDNRIEDSRGGFERSKYTSNDDGYAYHKPSGHQNSSSQGKWVQMQGGGNWGGQQQQMQQQEYWSYDQSQGYGNQQQAQWPINSADPRQQQWVNWYQNNTQPQQQQGTIIPDNTGQQYWSQYSYPNQGGTTVMSSHSSVDGSLKK